jgi:hypothetical protein
MTAFGTSAPCGAVAGPPGPGLRRCWACRWPLWRCRCTCCCPTTTPASSACRWPRWARCCWARGCWTPWPTRWLGRWVDRLVRPLGGGAGGRRRAALVLALGFRGAVLPAGAGPDSAAGLVRGAAGRHLPGLQRAERAAPGLGRTAGRRRRPARRIVSWREGLALVGVLVASVLPALAGLSVMTAVFAVALLRGGGLPAPSPPPAHPAQGPAGARALGRCRWRTPAFRRLLAVFLLNGVASAVPATLVLFFIRDRLQAQAWEPLFLASYFAAGALSMPLWVRAVARFGLARPGWPAWAWPWPPSPGRRCWARATWAATPPSAWPAAWPWAPTWPARRAAGRRDPARRPRRPGMKALLRLVELRHQAQPGPGRRPGPAAAGPAGLHARRPRQPTPCSADAGLCLLPCLLKLMAPRPAVDCGCAPGPKAPT